MRFGIGVLGATGYIGAPYRREIRACPDDARIVALCARRKDLLEAARVEDGAALATADWREVVEHPAVDLVVVATPDALHHEAVLTCARNGKHVLCEKPTGANALEAGEMWSSYDGSQLVHFVPFWTRYFPVFGRARELYRSGLLGEVRAVMYRWQNPRPIDMPLTWRDDATLSAAGSIADVGSHAYDTIRWILEEEAVRVLAHADVISDPKADVGAINLEEAITWDGGGAGSAIAKAPKRKGTAYDYGDLAFVLESGAVGSLVLSHAPFLRKGLAPELELHGTEASLGVDRLTGKLTLVKKDHSIELLETVEETISENRFRDHVFPALRQQLKSGCRDHPDLEDGYRVQLFTEAAARSAKAGAWVTLETLANEERHG